MTGIILHVFCSIRVRHVVHVLHNYVLHTCVQSAMKWSCTSTVQQFILSRNCSGPYIRSINTIIACKKSTRRMCAGITSLYSNAKPLAYGKWKCTGTRPAIRGWLGQGAIYALATNVEFTGRSQNFQPYNRVTVVPAQEWTRTVEEPRKNRVSDYSSATGTSYIVPRASGGLLQRNIDPPIAGCLEGGDHKANPKTVTTHFIRLPCCSRILSVGHATWSCFAWITKHEVSHCRALVVWTMVA